jgi:hypothetical protein
VDEITGPVSVATGAGIQTIHLTGISAGPEENQMLTVTATSDNQGLISDPIIIYSSPEATGILSYTPVAGQTGTAKITVTVTDDGPSHAPHVNSYSVTFTIKVDDYGPSEPEVTSLILIDAINDQPIMELTDGMTIYTSELPVKLHELNMEALIDPDYEGSIVFGINDNPYYSVRNKPVYAIGNHNGRDFHSWADLTPGVHTISATPYRMVDGVEKIGKTKKINITIKDDRQDYQDEVTFEILNFYPNPVKDYLTINFNSPWNNKITILFHDINGQLIRI